MWMTSDLAGKGQPGGVVAHEGEQGPVEEAPLGHDGQAPGAVAGGVPLPYELQRRVPRQACASRHSDTEQLAIGIVIIVIIVIVIIVIIVIIVVIIVD